MRAYLEGTDVLGAAYTAAPGPFLTVHIRDVPALVRAQGGALGELANQLVPRTVEAQVYETMRAQFEAELRKKNVAADVAVVASAPAGGALASRDFRTGAAAGAAAVGAGWLLWKLIRGVL